MSTLQSRLAQLTGIGHLAVRHKLMVLTILFVAVISAIEIHISFTLNQQKSDGLVVNIAGRQRMLTQKFTKEFFLASQRAQANNTALDKAQMEQTKRLFDVSLAALHNGGETYLDLGMSKPVTLPGTTIPEVQKQLGDVKLLWHKLQRAVEADISSTTAEEKLFSINQLSVKTLAAMNKAVGMLAAKSDLKVQTMLANQKWIWVAAILVSGLVAWLIANAIVRPLEQIVCITRRISDGDLKKYPVGIQSRDELGVLTQQVDEMRASLTGVICMVQHNSRQMAYSSNQIASISNEISNTSKQEQEGSQQVLQATSSLQQIATTVSEHINLASQTAEKTRKYATEGVAIVHEGIGELGRTVDSVNATAKEMEVLHQATGQISEIITTIHNIAEQTNLLALNAAIEAARAGEQGRGFAVVADEVRNLAGRTAESTTQITQLIQRLTKLVEGSVSSMQQVVEHVHHSEQKAEQTVRAFESMTDGINRTTDCTEQIAQYNQQQMDQLCDLHGKLDNLASVLLISAEKAGSTSFVATDLHQISDQLTDLLGQFETDEIAPEIRSEGEMRDHPRMQHQIKVKIAQGADVSYGQTMDISMTGIYIRCPHQFDDLIPVELQLYIPKDGAKWNESRLNISAKIVRSETEGGVNLYGLNFQSISEDAKEQLQQVFHYFGKPHKYERCRVAA
ncbi:Methyl-accepting chemotaxis protein I (serine chemoreceptor protein) [hydrothermal vent metagenome]|uniref:Methyl-accepting chemotaxis protein I (Serine chemoreceptor protein) n=1 Tax=hydrothermal vent metagenome TaxID=652676 RepID=A0A3B1B036_9ZZZZ